MDRFYLTSLYIKHLLIIFFLFVSSSYLSNYTDNNTLYASGFNLEEVKNCLSSDFDAVAKWFYENHIGLNVGKCHFMCLGKDTGNETFNFKGLIIKNRIEQTISWDLSLKGKKILETERKTTVYFDLETFNYRSLHYGLSCQNTGGNLIP